MVEKWAIKSSSGVLLEEIDDFLACYSVVTGKTHILDAFPAEIVKQLSALTQTSAAISAEFAARMGEDPGDWLPKIESVLVELLELHLVERCLS